MDKVSAELPILDFIIIDRYFMNMLVILKKFL